MIDAQAKLTIATCIMGLVICYFWYKSNWPIPIRKVQSEAKTISKRRIVADEDMSANAYFLELYAAAKLLAQGAEMKTHSNDKTMNAFLICSFLNFVIGVSSVSNASGKVVAVMTTLALIPLLCIAIFGWEL